MTCFKDLVDTPFARYALPIIPHGAKLSEHSSLTADGIGKIPGRRYPGGWGGFPKGEPWQDEWKLLDASKKSIPSIFALYDSWYEKDGYKPIIGFRSRELIGLDVDVEDKFISDLILRIAVEMLGTTCVRRRPNSNKFLLCYRHLLTDPTIPKLRRLWETQFGVRFAVEVCGDGQQWLAYGSHPSGVDYAWDLGLDPVTFGFGNIQVVTLDQLLAFFNRLEEEFAKLNYRRVRGGGDVRLSGLESRPRVAVSPTTGDRAPDLAMLKDVLTRFLPVTHAEFTTYDEWMTMCIAIIAACGGDEEFWPFFLQWNQGNPQNDDQFVRGKWESAIASGASVGWDYICWIAHEYGFAGDVQMMFDDLGEGEDDPANSEGRQPSGRYRGPIPKLLPAGFDVRKLPRRPFILGHRFMAGAVTLGVGAPGAGKSNLAILSALAIASGRALTGEEVHRSGRVWIHNNEDDTDELRRRIGGMLQSYEIDFESIRPNLFVTSGLDEPLVVAIKERAGVARTEAIADLIAYITEQGIVHLVIDPLISIHRGVSENSNEEIEQVIEAIQHIAHETGCSIDLIHHTLKPQSQRGNTEALAGDMNAARGASSLIGAVRLVYTVAVMSQATADKLGLHPAEAGRFVRVDHGKGNYSARDPNVRWFELEPFNIGNAGQDADNVLAMGDTVAVPKPWEPPSPIAEQSTQADDRERHRVEKRCEVLTAIVRVMSSDRVQLTKLLPAIEKQFSVKESAARTLIKKAIPERQEVPVEVDGTTYSLTIERQEPSPPGSTFIVRKLVMAQAEAA